MDYSLEDVNAWILSPDWTKIVVVRDPLDRLISAYIDKFVNWDGIKGGFSKIIFNRDERVSFEQFVDFVAIEDWEVSIA